MPTRHRAAAERGSFRVAATMIVAALAACSGDTETRRSDAGAAYDSGREEADDGSGPERRDVVDEPSAWTWDSTDEPEWTLSLETIELAAQHAVDALWELDALGFADAFRAAIGELGDGSCPEYVQRETEGTTVWYSDRCTDEGGTTYDGFGLDFRYEYGEVGGVPTYDEYGQLNGYVEAPDGARIGGYGQFFGGAGVELGGTYWYQGVRGLLEWRRSEGAETWFDRYPQGHATRGAGLGAEGRYVSVSGAVPLELDGVDAASVGEAGVWMDADGRYCGTDQDFVISVHQTSGPWYEVVFEQPAGLVRDGVCRLCGTVFAGDAGLGLACVDFGPLLLGWEGAPW